MRQSSAPDASPDRSATALVVSEVFPPEVGGSGELLWNVYRRLAVPVTVVTDGAAGAASAGDMGVRVIREPMKTRHWGLLHPAGLGHHLRRAARLRALARGPTVVHCGRALPEGLDAWMARRLGGAPYLCWTHGEELAYASASRELGALMRRVQRGAEVLLANSRNTRSVLEAYGAPEGRIAVVHPGVDGERFRPDVPGAAAVRSALAGPDELLLLTVGRLQRRKGHDLVLEALARLGDVGGRRVRYAIVGDGDERQRLQALSGELGVSDRVRFVGAVPGDALPAHYAAADLFVHPNRVEGDDFEGFGIVFLEAAAAGLPVVGGTTGGAPEAVADGVTGRLVSGSDPAELRAVLAELIGSPDLRRRMGAAGRARATREFSWARAAAQVAAIHAGIASRLGRTSNPQGTITAA